MRDFFPLLLFLLFLVLLCSFICSIVVICSCTTTVRVKPLPTSIELFLNCSTFEYFDLVLQLYFNANEMLRKAVVISI